MSNTTAAIIESIDLLNTIIEASAHIQRVGYELRATSDLLKKAHAEGRNVSDDELEQLRQNRLNAVASLEATIARLKTADK